MPWIDEPERAVYDSERAAPAAVRSQTPVVFATHGKPLAAVV